MQIYTFFWEVVPVTPLPHTLSLLSAAVPRTRFRARPGLGRAVSAATVNFRHGAVVTASSQISSGINFLNPHSEQKGRSDGTRASDWRAGKAGRAPIVSVKVLGGAEP